ncbi:hypothetical protein N9L68_02760 [bacterium]|nr:hypothetical protein [bacterium]
MSHLIRYWQLVCFRGSPRVVSPRCPVATIESTTGLLTSGFHDDALVRLRGAPQGGFAAVPTVQSTTGFLT